MSRPHSDGVACAFDPIAMLAAAQRRRMTPERFWAKVDRCGPIARPELGPCWLWTGRVMPDGYGNVTWCGRNIGAHRVACALVHGPLSAGAVVLHACDVPICCNPDHLRAGTVVENNADMYAKGRARKGDPALVRGERNVNAKLTVDIVRDLRAAWRAGESIKSIVERTGMSVGSIHPMLHGKTWAHVIDDDVPLYGGRVPSTILGTEVVS